MVVLVVDDIGVIMDVFFRFWYCLQGGQVAFVIIVRVPVNTVSSGVF